MKKKLILLIVLIIFLTTSLTTYLTYIYLDPFRNTLITAVLFVLEFILVLVSFQTLVLYVLKKVFYRWEVFLEHVFSSLRQSFIITVFLGISGFFYRINVFEVSTLTLLFIICLFVELLFQNLLHN